MKRVRTLLAFVAALLLGAACNYDVDISVTATAELIYDSGDVVSVGPVGYGDFHRKNLSDTDLENIFLDLTQHVIRDFRTAVLRLEVYDEIGGKHLRDEVYYVVYNSRTEHFDFADYQDMVTSMSL